MKCLNGKCSQGYDDCCRDCKERPHCTDACSFATDKDCEERYEPRHDMWKFAIEKRFAKNRFLISYRQNNSKGEKMSIELMKCEPLEVWQKSKSVPADLKEYWFINVYIKDRRNVEKFKGEKMSIELMKCEPLEVWQKSKSVPADLKEYWFINVYIKDRRNVEKFGNNPMILNGSVHFTLEVWQKSKSVPADLKEYWFINVYIKDRRNVEKFGNNPMILNGSVHFRWVLEATEENAVLLLKECEKRFHAEDDI